MTKLHFPVENHAKMAILSFERAPQGFGTKELTPQNSIKKNNESERPRYLKDYATAHFLEYFFFTPTAKWIAGDNWNNRMATDEYTRVSERGNLNKGNGYTSVQNAE